MVYQQALEILFSYGLRGWRGFGLVAVLNDTCRPRVPENFLIPPSFPSASGGLAPPERKMRAQHATSARTNNRNVRGKAGTTTPRARHVWFFEALAPCRCFRWGKPTGELAAAIHRRF